MEAVAQGGCSVKLGAIGYWAAWAEGQVVFLQTDGVAGHASRIIVYKNGPDDLLYVKTQDNLCDGVPASHVRRAVDLAATVLGPDHFPTREAEREYHRSLPWIRITHFGPWFGWRSGLMQIKGKPVLQWGVYRRRQPETLPDMAIATMQAKKRRGSDV